MCDRESTAEIPGVPAARTLSAMYEGFGPGGCAVMVACLTDNPNRTFGDVRQCFTKTKCKMGTPGTVSPHVRPPGCAVF